MTDFTEEATYVLFALWARTAGSTPENDGEDLLVINAALQAAYERGKQEERERCASLCEDKANKHGWNYNLPSVGRELAEAIREDQP